MFFHSLCELSARVFAQQIAWAADTISTNLFAHWAATVREFVGHKAFMNNPLNAYEGAAMVTMQCWPHRVDLLKDGYLQFKGKAGLGITLDEKLVKEKYMVAGETWWD